VIFSETGRYSQAEAAFHTLSERYADAAIGPAVLLARRDFELRRGNNTGADEAVRELCRRYPAAPECELISRTGSDARVRLAPTPARLLSGFIPQPVPARDEPGAGPAIVQTGSFRDEENAVYMVRALKNKGFEARVTEAVVREVRYYRVVVGSLQSTAQAQATLIRLKEAGFEGVLILPD
jgi:hypothetical protein